MKLFRREAVQHAERRIEGEVNLAVPLKTQLIAGLLCAGVVAALGYASVFPYSRKEMVLGVVVPDTGIVRITSPTSGTVERLMVREGDLVRSGDPLLEVGASSAIWSSASGPVEMRDVADTFLDREFSAAERRSLAERETLRAEQARLSALLLAQEAQLTSAQRRLEGRRRAAGLAERDFGRIEQLAERGFAAAREQATRETAFLQAQSEVDDAESARLALLGQIEQTRSLIAAGRQSELRRQAEFEVAEALYMQRKAEIQSDHRRVVTSSVNGRVATLPVSLGQPVSPDRPVAIIMPESDHLEAELYVPVRSVGLLRAGQAVRLQYDAFPHQRFGTGEGAITSISGAPLDPGSVPFAPQMADPVYRVRARLASTTIRAYGQTSQVQPGMTLQASVIVGRRSLLQWLMDPLQATGRNL